MVAADSQTVTELNNRARADLVANGGVEPDGITVTDESTIGAGDQIVTRLNQHDLHTSGGWVKSGSECPVVSVSTACR
jgi:hypothetical protein